MSEGEVKAGLNGTNGFAMPLFGFPRIALSGVFGELSEQGVARAQQGCEKIKAASEEMAVALRETYSSNARSATDYGLKVIEISNANTYLRDRFLRPSLGQQVGDGCLHLVRGASAQGFRHHIRSEQGLVGTCPEACDGNGGADQEARRQGSPPRQLSKGRSIHIQGSFKRATRPVGTSPATSMQPRAR